MKTPAGATELSPEDLKGLIPRLMLREELDEFEQENIASAFLWAVDNKKLKSELLTATGLLRLHKKMFDQTWKWAGQIRRRQTNIGVEPKLILSQLGSLLGDVKFWLEEETFPLDEIAVRFHHRLVWIHLFPNGNGRHARLAADLLLMHRGERPLKWGTRKIGSISEDRKTYLAAFREADKDGDFTQLLKFSRG